MSYIVKNCPCLFNSYYASGKIVRFECNDGNHDDKLCRDVTDCVIKQVIDKCTNAINTTFNNECFELAKEVTNLFDIEEVK